MDTLKRTMRPVHILVADDDQDDCLLMREAFDESRVSNTVSFVHNGEELIDYLLRHPPYNSDEYPLPGLILLDLNMPLMDGREALALIKQNSHLNHIPIVVLTTSSANEDITHSYAAGVNSFICKPVTFSGLVEVAHTLGQYWLELVELPTHQRGSV